MADERRLNGFERHIQTVIQVIITALVIWVGSAVLSVRESAIRLEEKYTQSRADITEVKTELTALRVQNATAASAEIRSQSQMKEVEARLGRIESILKISR